MTEREKRAIERAAFLAQQEKIASGTSLGQTSTNIIDHENRSSTYMPDDKMHARDLTNILYGTKNWRDKDDPVDANVLDIVKRISESKGKEADFNRARAAYSAASEKFGGDITPFMNRVIEESGALQASSMGEGGMRGPYSPEVLDAYWSKQDQSKVLPEHRNIGSVEWLEYIASPEFKMSNEWEKYVSDKKSGKNPSMPTRDVDLQKREYEYLKLMGNDARFKNFKDFQKKEYPESYKKASNVNKKRNKVRKTVGDSNATHMTTNQTYKEGQ